MNELSAPAALDPTVCYRALCARDARFDGRFYVGVITTGIFCRPICPARTPKPEHCTFHPSAAAAYAAGFRPCLRCRPEVAPGLAGWRGTAASVSRALALIAEGGLDGDDDTEALALRLGMSARHLRRLFAEHVGASPVAVASGRRVLFARQLIAETRMPLGEVALAAGFGSVRRFNTVMRRSFGRSPGTLRRPSTAAVPDGGITLRLPFVPPFDWAALLTYLAARAVPGVEQVEGDMYRRAVRLNDGSAGTIEIVGPGAGQTFLRARLRLPHVSALGAASVRLRRIFDLDADTDAIARQLGCDPLLAPLVAARPGLRLPGGWDPFELAVRTVLGQQVTVAGATTLIGRLVARFGDALPSAHRAPGLTHLFPRPEALACADLRGIGLPGARAASVSALAALVAAEPALLAGGDPHAAMRRLAEVPGIGPWTVQYIAMRVLREPDAFPATDLGLLRAAAGADGVRRSPLGLLARAEAWRPWRAYAAMYLWASGPAARTAPTTRRYAA